MQNFSIDSRIWEMPNGSTMKVGTGVSNVSERVLVEIETRVGLAADPRSICKLKCCCSYRYGCRYGKQIISDEAVSVST